MFSLFFPFNHQFFSFISKYIFLFSQIRNQSSAMTTVIQARKSSSPLSSMLSSFRLTLRLHHHNCCGFTSTLWFNPCFVCTLIYRAKKNKQSCFLFNFDSSIYFFLFLCLNFVWKYSFQGKFHVFVSIYDMQKVHFLFFYAFFLFSL
jgi:hypothetical protein